MRTPAIGRAAGTDRGRTCVLAAAAQRSELLRRSLSARPDSRRFYALTAGLAGDLDGERAADHRRASLASGRRSLGSEVTRPVLTGVASFALFYAAAAVARRDPFLRRSIASVLHYADEGTTAAVLLTASVNAAAEELFFRGALWDAASANPLASTTIAYTAVTAATGNPALAISAAITGVIFGRERARSGSVAAPAIAHMTWSALMLTSLPRDLSRVEHHLSRLRTFLSRIRYKFCPIYGS